MNFDVIVGNPPFSKRINNGSADLDSVFLERVMEVSDEFAMIIRSKHLSDHVSKFRKNLLSSGRVTKISHVDKKHFPQIENTETCVIYGNANKRNTITEINYKNGDTVHRTIDENTLIMFKDKDYSGAIEGSMSHRWTKGNLTRYKIDENIDEAGDDVVEIVDSKRGVIIKKIKQGLENVGRNQYGVVLNYAVDWGRLGRIEVKPYAASVSNSVVFLKTETDDEAVLLKAYLQTPAIKALVEKNMPSFHPTKTLFSTIPDINLDQ